MALAFQFQSWPALVFMTVLSIGFLLLMIGFQAMRGLTLVQTLVLLCLVTAVIAPSMLVRPHVFVWPILAVWLMLLMDARRRDATPLWWSVILLSLWANFHGSFVMGLFLAAVFALEAIVIADNLGKPFREWAFFGLLCLMASLATPYGVSALLYPLQVSSMETLPLIIEWRPSNLDQDWFFFVFSAAVFSVLLISRQHVGVIRFLAVMLLFYMGVLHVRHHAIFAIIASFMIIDAYARRSRTALPLAGPTPRLAASVVAVYLSLGMAMALFAGERPLS